MIRALIGGLCVAAGAAIVALLQGDFGDTHARIVGTSLGFSFFCGLGAAGDALRTQARGGLATAGAVASGLAAFAFALLTLAIWFDDSGSEFLWRAWGVVAITALWASHWSLVLRARRPADTSAVRTIARGPGRAHRDRRGRPSRGRRPPPPRRTRTRLTVERGLDHGPCRSGERSRTILGMREPLITATLFSIFVGTRGTAKAIGALQRLT
jgi:hypothetical protein